MLLTPLATTEDLRRWDAASAALGLPESLLMENAARAALDVLRAYVPDLAGRRVLCMMGGGNNGGDAACMARHLLDIGAQVLVLHTKPLGKLAGAARQHARAAKACGVEFRLLPGDVEGALARLEPAWHAPDIIVDGLLGTGFSGALRAPMTQLVAHINASGAFVLALDIPSGLDAMTGKPCPDGADAVCAHATATFAAATPGLVLPAARAYTGALHTCAIGIPRSVQAATPPQYYALDARCAGLLPPILANAHKNSFGSVLVLGGAPGMAGAAHLAALAALRAGAGLVRVAAPAASLPLICATLPDAMSLPCGADAWPMHMDDTLRAAIDKATALILGPGMGTSPACTSLLAEILRLPTRPPVVCDADALNTLAAAPDLLPLLRAGDICTPHPAEAARLLGTSTANVQAHRFAALRALCALAPCAFVLKGAGTLMGQASGQSGGQGKEESGGPVCIAPWDIPTLAVAGSGDVLSGCAGALLGRGLPALEAAVLAVAVHARAGMLCAAACPQRGALASDIAAHVPQALATLDALPDATGAAC